MKVGITGHKGFLGKSLVALLEQDDKVEAVEGFDLPESDIFDQDELQKFVDGKDVIIHLAGLNRADDLDLMRVNVLGTFSLLNAIKQKNPGCRVLFSSSFGVYAKSTADDVIDEDFPEEPLGVYGLSKLLGERMIQNMAKSHAIMRISNIYGPGCKPFYNAVTATFVHLAKEGKPISITGSGEQARDFIYVDDVASALKAAAFSSENGVFTVCTGESISLNRLAELIKKDFPALEITHTPSDEEFVSTKGSYRKAKDKLGWEPAVLFEEGIKRCYE